MRLIMIAALVLAACLPAAGPSRAAAVQAGTRAWPGGVVRVHIDPRIRPTERKYKDLIRAMAAWRAATGLRIELSAGERPPMLYVFDNGAAQCDAALGYHPRRASHGRTLNGGAMNLGKCSYGSVLHEFGHALGLMHEHQRADALSYLDLSPVGGVLRACRVQPQGKGCREAVDNINTRRPLLLRSDFDPCSLMMYLADQSPKARSGRFPAGAGWSRFYRLTAAGEANYRQCRALIRPDAGGLNQKTGQKREITCQDANTVAVFHGLRPRLACWGRGPVRGR